MIKVNTQTLTATREQIPKSLRGLSIADLTNLQTALNPVPAEFINIEWWPEVSTDQSLTDFQKFGDEIFVVDDVGKTVTTSLTILEMNNDEKTAVLDTLKSNAKTAVNVIRAEKVEHSSEWAHDGVTTHTWTCGRDEYSGTAAKANNYASGIKPFPVGFTWRTDDDIDVPMTLEQFKAYAAFQDDHFEAVYKQSFIAKAAIDAAIDAAGVSSAVATFEAWEH